MNIYIAYKLISEGSNVNKLSTCMVNIWGKKEMQIPFSIYSYKKKCITDAHCIHSNMILFIIIFPTQAAAEALNTLCDNIKSRERNGGEINLQTVCWDYSMVEEQRGNLSMQCRAAYNKLINIFLTISSSP